MTDARARAAEKIAKEQDELFAVVRSSADADELTRAVLGLRGDRIGLDQALLRAWKIIAGTLQPQFQLVTLRPARGPFASRRPPEPVGDVVAVYAWGETESRDLGYGEIDDSRFIAGITARGRHVRTAAFFCERAPWDGQYLFGRGTGPPRRLGAVGYAVEAGKVTVRAARVADYQRLLKTKLEPARALLQ